MKKYILILSLLIPAFACAQSYLPESNNSTLKVKPVVLIKAYAFNLKEA